MNFGELSRKSDRLGILACLDDLLDAGKRAAADKQDIRGIDLDELLLRMLSSALRRNIRYRSLQDLQQSLLHTLAGNIAGDGRVRSRQYK